MRTFSGEKLSAIGEVGRIQIRDTSIPSFYPVFSMAKPVRRMSVRPKIVLSRLKNRLQQNGKSFAAERKIVWLTLQKLKIQSLMPTSNGT